MTPAWNPCNGRTMLLIAGLTVLVGCSQPGSPDSATSSGPGAGAAAGVTGSPSNLPKVPFGNQPCQSLSQAEQQTLEQKAWGHVELVSGKADRAPAGLPFDNICTYHEFGVSYMTQGDYKFNRDGNHSTEHPDPTDLPGAFYDRQGGLWFARNGYYVRIAGSSKLDESAAHVIAAKL